MAQAELTAANAALAALEAPVPGAATAELQRAVTLADIEVRTASARRPRVRASRTRQ